MMNAQSSKSRQGSALLIVVAFLAMFTVLVLGFLARAAVDYQVSDNSTNLSGGDFFSQGAIDCIVGDLKQEIVDGSINSNGLYLPKANLNMVPAFSGITPSIPGSGMEIDGLNNVLKVSAYNAPFYPNATISRASIVATTTPSLDGRVVTPATWNKPLLMPATSPTDLTPTAAGFSTPNWIYVARDGSNPGCAADNASFGFIGNTANNSSPTNSNYVMGRYSYVIYNEGGLLDANVAGTPELGSLTPAQLAVWSRKGPAAFADLTQSQIGLTQPEVNTLVGWRNQSTAQVSGGNLSYNFGANSANSYFNSVLGLTTGFMSVGNNSLYNGVSDRSFIGRQHLISFMESIPGANMTSIQNALQYLTTFSRSLNQPSYCPATSRPLAGAVTSGGALLLANGSNYTGGNSANGLDNIYNPSFRSVRVSTGGWMRNDGSVANVGEPLVKERFALSRLCWITYKGPSANLPSSDPAIQQLLQDGVPLGLIQEGTTANILNYFGLTWYPGAGVGGLGGYWLYYHGLATGGQTVIGSLNDPSGPSVSATSPLREPDFFELLKAAVCCGSIGKTLSWNEGTNFTAITESSITFQILQIGANIIDQANPTQFPTHIEFNWGDGQNYLRSIYGSMDLPYFYSDHEISYIADQSQVSIPSLAWPTANLLSGSPALPPAGPIGVMSDPGVVVGMMVPTIWNPYDTNSANGASYPTSSNNLAPANLRITVVPAALTDPTNVAGSGNIPASNSYTVWRGVCRDPAPYGSPSAAPTLATQSILTTQWPTEDSTALTFNNLDTLYREPTVLLQPNIPAGSNLTLGPSNIIRNAPDFGSGGLPEVDSNNNKLDTLLGFYMGEYPQTFTETSIADSSSGATYTAPTGQCYYCTIDSISVVNRPGGSTGSTIRMEYQVGTQWIPYEEIYFNFQNNNIPTPYFEGTTTAHPSVLQPIGGGSYWSGSISGGAYTGGYAAPFTWIGPSGATGSTSNTGFFEGWFGNIMWDPRTTRFGENSERPCLPFISTTSTTDGTVYSHRPTTANDLFNPGALGALAQTSEGWFTASGHTFVGGISQNLNVGTAATATYYSDADGIVRRAMGGHTLPNPSTATGLPMATPAATSSRPVFLHRPFRSVAELGYVFSDTPWRNLDFSTSESGYSALLDVFCINEENRSDAMIAGRVDLNTRQAPVLQALMSGAYRDEIPLATGAGNDVSLTGGTAASEAGTLASLLLQRTNPGNTASGKGPLVNIAGLVGTYVPGALNPNQEPYDGFSEDLTYSAGPSPANTLVPRFREAAFRALSDAGQVGTWNLLIDVVAQSGRCPATATALSNFVVKGERHYWVHVAIDRQTGTVIDESIEPVNL